jgi:hypothetical protein
VNVSTEEVKVRIVGGIDRALSHTWVIPAEDRRLLRAVRSAVMQDDQFVARVGSELTLLGHGDPDEPATADE